jgi:hypothetical protein
MPTSALIVIYDRGDDIFLPGFSSYNNAIIRKYLDRVCRSLSYGEASGIGRDLID